LLQIAIAQLTVREAKHTFLCLLHKCHSYLQCLLAGTLCIV